MSQKEYKPVTAYTVTRPVIVNGVDINDDELYTVLNYKPERARYPYIYVPIAEFRRVGADVYWDPNNQVLTVESNNYINVDELDRCKSEVIKLRAKQAILSKGL